jgi:hypothetical protein
MERPTTTRIVRTADPNKVDSMTIFDAPNFVGFSPKKYKYWRATFVSFVLCDGEVVRQIRWKLTLEVDEKNPRILKKTYDVDKDNVMPDPKDVKKFSVWRSHSGRHAVRWARTPRRVAVAREILPSPFHFIHLSLTFFTSSRFTHPWNATPSV